MDTVHLDNYYNNLDVQDILTIITATWTSRITIKTQWMFFWIMITSKALNGHPILVDYNYHGHEVIQDILIIINAT